MEGRLRLFFLPGYSPELNPDEWVWKNVKHDRIGKTGVTSRQDLKSKAIGGPPTAPETPRSGPGILRRPARALHHCITRISRTTYARLSNSDLFRSLVPGSARVPLIGGEFESVLAGDRCEPPPDGPLPSAPGGAEYSRWWAARCHAVRVKEGDPDFTALAISVALAAAGAVTPIAGLVAPGWTAVAGVLSVGVSPYS